MHTSSPPITLAPQREAPAPATQARYIKTVGPYPFDRTQKPGDFICTFDSIDATIADAVMGLPQCRKDTTAATLLAGKPLNMSGATYQMVGAVNAAVPPAPPIVPAEVDTPLIITPLWRAFAYLLPILAQQEDALILSDSADEIGKLPAGSTRTILESLHKARADDVTEGRELVEEEALDDRAYCTFLGKWNEWRDETVRLYQGQNNRKRAL